MKLETFDLAIAGAGIGGLALATLAARQGARVVIYDQMEAPKAVGSGFVLQPTGAAILASIGLLDTVAGNGKRIDRMIGRLTTGKAVLDVHYRKGGFGIAIQRVVLFDLLLDAAQRAGVKFKARSAVQDVEGGERPRFMLASGHRTAPADLIVDAMGASSPIGRQADSELEYGALWATVPWQANGPFQENLLEQRYHKASRMAGILPVGRTHADAPDMATFFWSLRKSDHLKWLDRGHAQWLREIEKLWPQAAPLAAEANPVFARYRHQTRPPLLAQNALRIGDAWHATSPQLGQGANMALLDAASLAAALQHGRSLDHAIQLHLRQRRLHVLTYQSLSRVLTPFYQSDSRTLPLLRDRLIAPLSLLPGIRQMISTIVTGELLDPVGRIKGRSTQAP